LSFSLHPNFSEFFNLDRYRFWGSFHFCTVLIETLNIREIPRTETLSQISLEIIGLVPLRHALLR
jgi:hypothetical protein